MLKHSARYSQEMRLGLFCIACAALLILVVIPSQTETGLLQEVRRRVIIGDAFLPTIASGVLFLAGLLQVFRPKEDDESHLGPQNLRMLFLIVAIVAIALLLMRWTGPAAVQVLQHLGVEIPDYRTLRATAPWKYLGFILGSTFLISALASLSKGSFRISHVLYALLISVLVALFYDVPFRNLLLPPNGDL